MKNGLYGVVFSTPLGQGGGVAVFRDGRILGGDSMMSYVGDYEIKDGKVRATVAFKPHGAVIPGMSPVFGVERGTIVLTGPVTADRATLIGESPAAPGVKLDALVEFITD
jgi:hypothetical protein